MVIGLVILINTPDEAMRIGLSTAIAVAVPFAVIFIIILIAVLKSLRQPAATGSAGMIGLVGIAVDDIFKNGRVRVRGEYWNACSASPISAGRQVKILNITDLKLQVEEVKE